MSARRKGVARVEEYWTPEEYRAALERAAAELKLPPRGKRGSKANTIRRAAGGRLAWLARQFLWKQRAERWAQQEERHPVG